MKKRLYPILIILLSMGLVGCDDSDDEDDAPVGGGTTASASAGNSETQSASAAENGGSMDWETKTDPVEQAFSIELPKGWKNDAYLKRKDIITIPMATSESLDGTVAMFYGDAKIPTFIEPQYLMPHQQNDPNVRGQTYTPAEQFMPGYLKSRFGKLPGFQITGVTDQPDLVAKNREKAQEAGINLPQLDSVRVDFTYNEGGKTRQGAVYGTTASVGIIWMASVAGIVSNEKPLQYKDTLFHIIWSQKTLPEWKEKERQMAADRQRQHEYAMAQIARNTQQLQINHQNNMATLQGMAARHQLRMDAIHAAGDASMAAYKARDIASDNNHRGFLNYITEQNTVGTSSGQTFQVDNKYDRYYFNKSDNSYIGLNGGTNLNDLQGVNPGDYEEAKIIR